MKSSLLTVLQWLKINIFKPLKMVQTVVKLILISLS